MADAKLRFGLLACGSMARALANRLKTIDEAEIVAVTDIDAERRVAAATEFGAQEEDSDESLLARDDIDAAIVASPPAFHAGQICAALKAGKHVFSEKPLTLTVEDGLKCLRTARECDRFLGVGQVLRYNQPWETMLSCVRSGEYGKPMLSAEIRMGRPLSRMNVPWRCKMDLCGGWLFEVGAHELDFICEVFDAWPTHVSAFTVPPNEELTKTDDNCVYSVNLYFEGGGVGHYLAGQVDFGGSRWSRVLLTGAAISGSGGAIEVMPEEGERFQVEPSEEGKENGVRRELRQFTQAVLAGRQPVPTDVEGLRAVAVGVAALKSAANKEVVACERPDIG